MKYDDYFEYGYFLRIKIKDEKLKITSYGSSGKWDVKVPFSFKVRLIIYMLFGFHKFVEKDLQEF